MPMYEYECPVHGRWLDSGRGDFGPCPVWEGNDDPKQCNRRSKRKWSFQLAPVMQEHLNVTTGLPVSSKRQFADQLKRASEEASRRSLEGSLEFARAAEEQGIDIGDFKPREIPHNYVPIEDKEQLGVTDEGMDATMKERTDKGVRERKFYS